MQRQVGFLSLLFVSSKLGVLQDTDNENRIYSTDFDRPIFEDCHATDTSVSLCKWATQNREHEKIVINRKRQREGKMHRRHRGWMNIRKANQLTSRRTHVFLKQISQNYSGWSRKRLRPRVRQLSRCRTHVRVHPKKHWQNSFPFILSVSYSLYLFPTVVCLTIWVKGVDESL